MHCFSVLFLIIMSKPNIICRIMFQHLCGISRIFQICLLITAVVVFIQLKFKIVQSGNDISNLHGTSRWHTTTTVPVTTNCGGSEQHYTRVLLTPPHLLLPFPAIYRTPLIDRRNKLIFCTLPKNSCTQIKAAFCRKFRGMKSYNDTLQHNYIHEVCKIPRINDIRRLKTLYSDPSWLKLAIIRDPIERFISAFVDKCRPTAGSGASSACFNTRKNFADFVHRFTLAVHDFSTLNKRPEMALFNHFMPQYWFCGFDIFYEEYKIIKMDNDRSDFPGRVRKQLLQFDDWKPVVSTGWGPFGDKSLMEVKEHESPNKTETVEILQLLEHDICLVDKLYRTFYVDYVRFNLTIPKWISSSCRGNAMGLAVCEDALK